MPQERPGVIQTNRRLLHKPQAGRIAVSHYEFNMGRASGRVDEGQAPDRAARAHQCLTCAPTTISPTRIPPHPYVAPVLSSGHSSNHVATNIRVAVCLGVFALVCGWVHKYFHCVSTTATLRRFHPYSFRSLAPCDNMALVYRQSPTPEEASVHNARLPVSRLSDDILQDIFLEATSSSPLGMATDDAMDLSHVYRRWRIVALSSGRLWARLSGGPSRFELSLARSLSAPLYLELDTRHISTTRLAFDQVHRIVEMTLFVSADVVASGQQVALTLRTLELDFAPEMRELAFLAGWGIPKLEKLSLAHTSLRSNGHFLVETITALELVKVDCYCAADAPG